MIARHLASQIGTICLVSIIGRGLVDLGVDNRLHVPHCLILMCRIPGLSSTERSSYLFEAVVVSPSLSIIPLRVSNNCCTQPMERIKGRNVSWLEKILPVPGLLLTTFLAIGFSPLNLIIGQVPVGL